MASLYNVPLLYFLIIVFIALFIGSDLGRRTLNTYITAGHKRSCILWAKVIVSQIGCIIILIFPLLMHGVISQFCMKEKFIWGDNGYTILLVTLLAMITMCTLPIFLAFIFGIWEEHWRFQWFYFCYDFFMNSEYAQTIIKILPMGQLRLISLQKFYSIDFFLLVDFLWNVILYMVAGNVFYI